MAGLAIFLWWMCLAHTVFGGWSDWEKCAVHVQAGQSIQAAIDAAQPGTRILVEAGTYAEQLTIENDGIYLIGLGAILTPPDSPTENTCSGLAGPDTEAGICVTGHDIELADFVTEHRKVISVGQPVKDVLVTGFDIRGFSGLNIAVVGGLDVQVLGNVLTDGVSYGCLTVGSTNTHVDGNSVSAPSGPLFIGICTDNTPGVQVSNNNIDGYLIGLCIQTAGAQIFHNTVTNSCFGAFVDPGIVGAQLYGNHISQSNPICGYIPELGIVGIILDGSSNTEVRYNTVEGFTSGGLKNATGVGVGVIDEFTTDPVSVASGNEVIGNTLIDNDLKVFVNTTGTGNIIENN